MNSLDSRRPRTSVNHLRFKNNLHALAAPVAGSCARKLIHVAWVNQELSGRDGATARQARNYDRKVSGIRVEGTDHKGIILVGACILLRTIQNPFLVLRMLAIFNPKLMHVRAIRKMKSQRRGEAQCPAVVKSAYENRGCLSQVTKCCSGLSLHAERAAVRIQHPRNVNQRADIVNNDRYHMV